MNFIKKEVFVRDVKKEVFVRDVVILTDAVHV